MPTPELVLYEAGRGKDGVVVGGGRRDEGEGEDRSLIAPQKVDGVEAAGDVVRLEKPAEGPDGEPIEAAHDDGAQASARPCSRGPVCQSELEERLLVSLLESLLLSV